jgi:hypothetical protein
MSKKDFDLNITTKYTEDNTVSTGSVVNTHSAGDVENTKIDEIKGSGISLDDLHTYYVNHENSGEATYQYLTDFLKENKDNSDVINNTVSTILAELNTKYDQSKVHGKVAGNQADYLSTIFSSDKGEETSALICGTIHNFLRDSLQDAGIEAVTVVGADTGKDDGFTNHACLLYKNSDGTYQFNNYGKSATIEANNIKDAVYTVHKETGLLESGGHIQIFDKDSSYQEYALSDSSAYGHIVDKRDYNAVSPANNPVADKSSLDIKSEISKSGNIGASASATFATDTDNGAKSTTVGIEYKKSGENAEFYNSTSIGAMVDHAKTTQIAENTNLTYDVKGVYSHTTGQLGGETYSTSSGDIVGQDGGKISYETVMLRGNVGTDTQLYNNGNTSVSNLTSSSLMGTGVLGHSNHYSSSYDARMTMEDGIRLQTGNSTQAFDGTISGGVVVDLQEDNNGFQPTLGTKLNIGANYFTKPTDNLTFGASVNGYNVNTKSSTDYGVSANVGATLTNPNSSSTVKNIWGNVGVGIENQNLHVGGFNQATERNTTFNATAGMDIGKKSSVSLNYSQNKNILNPTKNTKNVWATFRMKF